MLVRLGSGSVQTLIASTSACPNITSRASRKLHTQASKHVRSSYTPDSTRTKRPSLKRTIHASAPLNAAPKDPYKVLGVSKDASAGEIKKIYFNLARKYHPDTNKDEGARDKFGEIQDAYDVLKDDTKRANYDKYGAASFQQGFDPNFANAGGGGGFGGFQGGFNPFGGGMGGMGGSADLFDQLFGAFGASGSAGAQNSRGGDIEASVNVSFLDACKGVKRSLNVDVVVDCGTCKSTGLKAGAKRTTCPTCNGTGQRTFVIQGGFHAASTCTTCSGTGSTVPTGSQCGTCAGVGKVREKQSVQVNIPPGVDDGMVIRMARQGDAPINGSGPRGDLHVRVNVASSKHFRRQGTNLLHDARIPWHTAVLGGRVRVPTLDGEVDVRVPGGTQQGESMVLKSRGVPSLNGVGVGDLLVNFTIQIPRSTTARQRAILQQYVDDLEGKTPSSETPPPPPKPETSTNREPEQQKEQPQQQQNGANSSPPGQTSSSTSTDGDGGWLSRALNKLRGLTGN